MQSCAFRRMCSIDHRSRGFAEGLVVVGWSLVASEFVDLCSRC